MITSLPVLLKTVQNITGNENLLTDPKAKTPFA